MGPGEQGGQDRLKPAPSLGEVDGEAAGPPWGPTTYRPLWFLLLRWSVLHELRHLPLTLSVPHSHSGPWIFPALLSQATGTWGDHRALPKPHLPAVLGDHLPPQPSGAPSHPGAMQALKAPGVHAPLCMLFSRISCYLED